MYAVTYEALDLNLLPSVLGAEVTFNGELDLNASPNGVWDVDDIYVQTARPPLCGIMPTIGRERLAKDSPLYPLIIAAAQAYDRQTRAITDQVIEELRDALHAGRAEAARSLLAAE